MALLHAYNGRVAGIRGLFGFFFSRGIDKLIKRVNRELRLNTKMYSHTSDSRLDRDDPTIIIGHSLGANQAIDECKDLKSEGKIVDLLVLYDPAFWGRSEYAPARYAIPSNVKECVCYVSRDGRAKKVKNAKGNTKTKTINVIQKQYSHVRIAYQNHDAVIAKIREVLA